MILKYRYSYYFFLETKPNFKSWSLVGDFTFVRFWTLVSDFRFWTPVADIWLSILESMADILFWTSVADFLFWTLVADYRFWTQVAVFRLNPSSRDSVLDIVAGLRF